MSLSKHKPIFILEIKSLFDSLLLKYISNLQENPILTKALTGSIIAGSGDIIAQEVTNQSKWNIYRTLKFIIYGCIASTLVHFWYQILDKIFKNRTGKWNLLKIIIDQIIFGPFINSIFFIVMSSLDGYSFDEIYNKISISLFPQLKNHWKFWPIVQFINFTYIPPMFRVLFSNCMAFFWNIFISIKNNERLFKRK